MKIPKKRRQQVVAYRQCEVMPGFDDKKFKKRAQRLGLAPAVMVPK